jgi:hypothetical protein
VGNDQWPFAQPRDTAAFITSQVLERTEPILHVVHDEDGEWQFIGSTDGTIENARLICLHHPVDMDPSVLELADLPIGWHAVRDSPESSWMREVDSDATPTV